MSEPSHTLRVQANNRTGSRGDVWHVTIDGSDDAATVESWQEAVELAAERGCELEAADPRVRREMVEAGIPRAEFGEATPVSLFSHPHGTPDI